MRLVALLIIFLIFLWSFFWWAGSQQIYKSVQTWFHEEKEAGKRQYERISLRGFPNRFDLSIENVNIIDKDDQFSISTELIQLLRLIYNRNHIIGTIKPPINLKIKGKRFEIDGDWLKSSFKFKPGTQVASLIFQGKNLTLTNNNDVWKSTDFLVAVEKAEGLDPTNYNLHITINNITLQSNNVVTDTQSPLVGPTIKKISINSAIKLSYPLDTIFTKNSIKELNGLKMEMEWGLIKSSLNGNLKFSNHNLLSGTLEIALINWNNLIFNLRKENILDDKLLKKIKAAMTFIASQKVQQQKSIALTIKVKDNLIFLGPLRIGKINLESLKL